MITGNPTVTQFLFAEKHVYESEEWKILKKHNKHFITAQTIRAYLGNNNK
jgi:hypothetical protein